MLNKCDGVTCVSSCWAVRAGGLQREPICPWASPIRRVCHACQRCHSCGNQREGMKNSFALTHVYFLKQNLKPEGQQRERDSPRPSTGCQSRCPVQCFHHGGIKMQSLVSLNGQICTHNFQMLDLQAGCSVTRSVKVKALIKYVHTAPVNTYWIYRLVGWRWLALVGAGWRWMTELGSSGQH